VTGWVDVHPLPSRGRLRRQADPGGGFFEYPPDAFGQGRIAGASSGACQHASSAASAAGTKQPSQDTHDLTQLDALTEQ